MSESPAGQRDGGTRVTPCSLGNTNTLCCRGQRRPSCLGGVWSARDQGLSCPRHSPGPMATAPVQTLFLSFSGFVCFCASDGCQCLLLTLCSGVMPGGAQGILPSTRDGASALPTGRLLCPDYPSLRAAPVQSGVGGVRRGPPSLLVPPFPVGSQLGADSTRACGSPHTTATVRPHDSCWPASRRRCWGLLLALVRGLRGWCWALNWVGCVRGRHCASPCPSPL